MTNYENYIGASKGGKRMKKLRRELDAQAFASYQMKRKEKKERKQANFAAKQKRRAEKNAALADSVYPPINICTIERLIREFVMDPSIKT